MKKIWDAIKTGFIKTICPIFTQIKWLEIPVATYVRWILAIILSINTILTAAGINPIPFSENAIYEVVSLLLNIAVLFVNTYKNNSTSKEALISDKIMRALKAADNSTEDDAIGKLHEILAELNGEDYIPKKNDDQKVDDESHEE